MKQFFFALVALCTIFSTSTQAQALDYGWYGAVEYASISSTLTQGTAEGSSSPVATNVRIGKLISPRLALEVFSSSGLGEADVENGTFDMGLNSATGFSAVYLFPNENGGDFNLKIGTANVQYGDNFDNTADGSGITLGLGAKFRTSENFGITIDYISYPEAVFEGSNPIYVDASSLNFGIALFF